MGIRRGKTKLEYKVGSNQYVTHIKNTRPKAPLNKAELLHPPNGYSNRSLMMESSVQSLATISQDPKELAWLYKHNRDKVSVLREILDNPNTLQWM
jgi:hypothetical protein